MASIKIDVRNLRKTLNMTQKQFSDRFGFELSTLRHWEQGQRVPTGPTRLFLFVISQHPEVVEATVAAAHNPVPVTALTA